MKPDFLRYLGQDIVSAQKNLSVKQVLPVTVTHLLAFFREV